MFSLNINLGFSSHHIFNVLTCLKILLNVDTTNLSGSGTGNSKKAKVTVDIPVTLENGKNTIDLLSLTVGLQVQTFS